MMVHFCDEPVASCYSKHERGTLRLLTQLLHLGLLPQAASLAKHLLQKVRPWVEPAQSYEKHQLGLGRFFLNSLHLTWIMALLADTVVLLRAQALLSHPRPTAPLGDLTPKQLTFSWD